MPAAPLVPTTVPVLFGKLDTKTAPRLAQQGTLVECSNAQMSQTGRVQKRDGFAALPHPAAMTPGKALAAFGDQLVGVAGDQVWSYSPSGATFTSQGPTSPVQPSVRNVVSNSSSQTVPDVAVGGGYAVYAWEELVGTFIYIRYAVEDLTTGQAIVQNALVDGGATTFALPKVVYQNGQFVIFYQSSNTTIKARRIAVSTPTAIGAITTVTTALNSVFCYDVFARGAASQIAVAYPSSSTGLTQLLWNPATMTGGTPVGSSGASLVKVLGYLTHDYSDSKVYLGYATGTDTTTGVGSALVYDSAFASLGVPSGTSFSTFALQQATQVTGWVQPGTLVVHLLWQASATASPSVAGNLNDTITHNGTIFKRGAGLGSRVWLMASVPYVIALYEGARVGFTTNQQQTCFVLRITDGEIVARFLSQAGGGMRARGSTLSSATLLTGSTTKIIATVTRKVQDVMGAVAVGGFGAVQSVVKSVSKVELDHAASLSNPRVTGDTVAVAGGTLRGYDGGAVSELGFHLYPEAPQVATVALGGFAATNRSYRAVYAWFDRAGNLHHSASSEPKAFSNAVNFASSITVAMLRMTSKTTVIIEIYAALSGDPNYYRITPTTVPLVNDPTIDTVTFVDSTTSADLITYEPLYTNGGVYPHDPPPPARIATMHRDRLWLAGQDLPGRIWPSAPIVADQGISFSGNFEIVLDAQDGEPTAIDSLDDKVVVFTRNGASWIGGEGPDVLGRGDFSVPTRIPGSIGTTEPESVVRTAQGLMFRASDGSGIYLLDRGLNVTYIGADVETWNNYNVSGALVLPEANQTLFTTVEGTTLVRDEHHQRWYTWSNQAAVACCRYNNLFVFMAADGTVYQQTPGVYSDAGTAIAMRLVLAWLQPFNPGGYGRLWALHLIGDYHDAHTVRVGLRYDHVDATIFEQLTIDAAAACAAPNGDYRFEVRPRLQRFSAVQIIIEDVIGSGTPAGLDLSALALLVGAQPGSLARLPAARQMGSV